MPQTFHTIVFQAAPGGGNPCPVTLYADALSSEDMQAMAKAFGEESAFLLTPTLNGCDIRARYFVPLHEMEMCVHATIANTTVLAQKDIFTHSPIIFETALGAIPVYWKEKSNDPDQSLNSANQSTCTKNGCIEQTKSSKVSPIKVSIEQFLPKFANNNPSLEEVCCALAITADDIGDGPIQSVATSRFKLIVPLKDRCVLEPLNLTLNTFGISVIDTKQPAFIRLQKKNYHLKQQPSLMLTSNPHHALRQYSSHDNSLSEQGILKIPLPVWPLQHSEHI